MNLVATNRLAHALGAENFGLNSFAISYVAYFLVIVNLGYDTLIAREIAYDSSVLRRLVESAIAVRLLLAIVMAMLLLASLPALRLSWIGDTVVMIQGANLFSSAVGVTSAYQGLQRMRVVAVREFMASLINLVGILWLVRSQQSILAAAAVSAGTMMLTNIPLLVQYAFDFGAPRVRLPQGEDFRRARQSMTYFWSGLLFTVSYNMHIVLLGLMRSQAEVGLFVAGFKVFTFAIVIPQLISTLFLPRIAACTTQREERLRCCTIYMQAVLIFALPIAMLGEAMAPQILKVLFGSAYLPASTALAVLLLNGLVVSLNIGFGTPLLAVGRQTTFLRVTAAGTAIGAALYLILIPLLGIEGAALGALADEAAILGLFIRNHPEPPIPRTLDFGLRCMGAALLAAILARFAAPVVASDLAKLAVGGAVGGTAYVMALRALGVDLIQFAAELRRLP